MSLEDSKGVFKEIQYNFAQLLFILCRQLFIVLEWARGTGKSTIIARRIIDCVNQMPRSTGIMPAETYMQIKTRTLPSTIAGLEMHGWKKGFHYFVGEKPPKAWKWPEPYEPPLDYKHSIIFWNGTCINFISQDGGGASGRGMNVDWVIVDEFARLKEAWFETDVLLTNRGNMNRMAHYPDGTKQKYKDCSLHHSVMAATSTPVTLEGKWILKYEQKAKEKPDSFAFLRASAIINIHNLGKQFFINAKNTMIKFLYDAEVLNIRVGKVKDGFYPKLNEAIHCYTAYNNAYYEDLPLGVAHTCEGDMDLDPSKPLILGVDWGARINCMVVCQDHGDVFKFIKNLYVKTPKIIDDLAASFCTYYAPRLKQNNVLHMFYDPSGNVGQANSRLTNAQLMKKLLDAAGWDCRLMTRGQYNIPHEDKYNLWNELLKGSRPDLPLIQFNKGNCLELWISMTNTPVRTGQTEAIKKDKRSETKDTMLQEHATHLGDAADTPIVGMFINKVTPPEPLPPPRLS